MVNIAIEKYTIHIIAPLPTSEDCFSLPSDLLSSILLNKYCSICFSGTNLCISINAVTCQGAWPLLLDPATCARNDFKSYNFYYHC